MTSSPSLAGSEARWKTYLKAGAFLAPSLILWMMTREFFISKLLLLWKMGGGPETEAQWVVDGVVFLAQRGGYLFAGLIAFLVLAEWRLPLWRLHRMPGLVVAVFVVNLVILTGIWFTCLAVLLIAPALGPGK